MTTLLIIGAPTNDHTTGNELADKVGNGDGEGFLAARCGSPAQLPGIVARVSFLFGRIDILDIFDHGHVGSINMGDEALFQDSGSPNDRLRGWEIAKELAPYLAETAHVRLLGCHTAGFLENQGVAATSSGRQLLVKLALELGRHRVAFGTIDVVNKSQFSEHGFEGETAWLSSSSAALDHEAVCSHTRTKNRAEIVSPYLHHIGHSKHSSCAILRSYNRLRAFLAGLNGRPSRAEQRT